MNKRLLATAVLSTFILSVSGCANHPHSVAQPVSYAKHQGQVKIKRRNVMMYYEGDQQRPSLTQIEQLLAFLNSEPVARVTLSTCDDGITPHHRVKARMTYLSKYLRRRGFLNIYNAAPIDSRNAPKNCVLVSVSFVDTMATNCEAMVYETPFADSFGCATDRNLRLMLADPRDLYQRKELTEYDGEHLSRAVERYRHGEQRTNNSFDTSLNNNNFFGAGSGFGGGFNRGFGFGGGRFGGGFGRFR